MGSRFRRGLRFTLAAWACAVLASAPIARARADSSSDVDRQIAQSLFDEGRALLDAGRAREACPKFAESQRLDPGGGTLLNLALCLELEGKTASAWARYQDAIALALRDGRKDREEFARAHLAELTPKLTRLVVSVPPELASADRVVQLDGSRLTQEAWGTAIAIDPGKHRLTSSAGGMLWETDVEAAPSGGILRVEVGAGASSASSAGPRDASSPRPIETHRSAAFWIMLGTGAATVVASGVFGLLALDANREARGACAPERGFCSPEGRDAGARARERAWLSTGLMAGGVLLGAGAFLLPLDTKTAPLTATLSASGGTLSCRGSF